ncbi:MAG: DEAD/DEAH box helicase [Actinobacteria bacterium]|jgi:superfamily II DNA/RNA helicase|nr:DEAD/DEAH box helicase [Actinomycetota bacterium]
MSSKNSPVNPAVTSSTFASLGLRSELIKTLDLQGITSPFPIQEATIPDAIAGFDILGRGQTGSGKTLAFGLALLNNIFGKSAKPNQPLALVLAPTRELAQQIDDVLKPLAKSIGHSTVVIAGGVPYGKQINALSRGVSILVATPGRLNDLIEKKEVRLDALLITVLDEADHMADMGFLPAVKKILDKTRKGGQRLLFSATLDRGVDSLVRQYLKDPKSHTVKELEAEESTMDHYVFVMKPTDKASITSQIASRDGKTLLFVRTQHGADRLAANLAKAGVIAGSLHGGKSQAVRNKTLARFKEEDSAVLVATDVAARGIHVDGIDLVVHFDAPADHKDYLHRSGRTARAGQVGRVVTLATHKEQRTIGGITLRAGVEPWVMGISPMDERLVKITGAKEPSGIPYIEKVEKSEKVQRGSGRGRSAPSSKASAKPRRGRTRSRNRYA